MSLKLFLTYIAPLMTVTVTVTLWAVLIAVQSPRPYWRDTMNIALAGVFGTLALYLVSVMLQAAGIIDDDLVADQKLVIVAGIFAAIGLPSTLRELHRVLTTRTKEDV